MQITTSFHPTDPAVIEKAAEKLVPFATFLPDNGKWAKILVTIPTTDGFWTLVNLCAEKLLERLFQKDSSSKKEEKKNRGTKRKKEVKEEKSNQLPQKRFPPLRFSSTKRKKRLSSMKIFHRLR